MNGLPADEEQRSALYYPHTQLPVHEASGQRILKRALLMWDHLEFIVPDPKFKPNYSDPIVAEAIDLIGKNHYPNAQEKTAAHEQIEELITRPNLPEVFYYKGSEPYEMYPTKFPQETWDLLLQSKHAGSVLPDGDYPLSMQAGLALMAILADCCAGTTRSRVTNRGQAYSSLAGLLMDNPKDAARDRLVDMDLRTLRGEDSLISLRLTLPDIDALSLDQLIKYRKREERENGHTLRNLRHKYVARIEKHVTDLTTNPKLTQSDVEELERLFFQGGLDDLRGLQQELGVEKQDLGKDIVATVVAAAGTVAASVLPAMAPIIKGVVDQIGQPVKIFGALSRANKFSQARAAILRKHPLALLYELHS
jgi:hypothetical protein